MPANIAYENQLVEGAAIDENAASALKMALDDVCILYDRAESRAARAQQAWYHREQSYTMELARDVLRSLRYAIERLPRRDAVVTGTVIREAHERAAAR